MELIRLTQFSPGAGCGCKISPAELRTILNESLPKVRPPVKQDSRNCW